MAISATLYSLLSELKPPKGCHILELGEAEWYGDLKPVGLFSVETPSNGWNIAKAFYRHWCEPSSIVSIDKTGPNSLQLDLNRPVDINGVHGTFDVVINHGTMEHVFHTAQFLVTMHDYCCDGGLMIHDAPFTGWIDHGFYCFQPTLFYDLAACNGYEVVAMAMHEIKSRRIVRLNNRDHILQLAGSGQVPMNAMLFAAMRKRGSHPFRIPQQGFYSPGVLSAAGSAAWRTMR